jgi:putative nucleotidyltransferase with HDIG domain
MFGQFKSEQGFDMDRLWEHSVGCAVASRVLAEAAQLNAVEEVFAGGLMHDIGKVVHAVNLPKQFVSIIKDVQETGRSIIEAEEEVLGFNHAETGRALAEKWGFPGRTVDMIACHHLSNGSVTLTKEIAAVHLGNTLCSALSLGSGGEQRVPIANEKAWQTLDLTLSQLEPIMGRIKKVFQESISALK